MPEYPIIHVQSRAIEELLDRISRLEKQLKLLQRSQPTDHKQTQSEQYSHWSVHKENMAVAAVEESRQVCPECVARMKSNVLHGQTFGELPLSNPFARQSIQTQTIDLDSGRKAVSVSRLNMRPTEFNEMVESHETDNLLIYNRPYAPESIKSPNWTNPPKEPMRLEEFLDRESRGSHLNSSNFDVQSEQEEVFKEDKKNTGSRVGGQKGRHSSESAERQ